jgi:hypothetical protein
MVDVIGSGKHYLAYYDTAIITAVKSFTVQAPDHKWSLENYYFDEK